jgi:glc operon protein GlcG
MQSQPSLDHVDAHRIATAIVAEAERCGQSVVVVVTDPHGEPLALVRMSGAALTSITIALNKAYSSARDRKTTLELGTKMREKGYDIAYYGDPRFVGWGGGVPVRVDGLVVGAVAVSGLSQEDDEALAKLGISTLGI